MTRARAPIWLAAPTRFAGVAPGRARVALLLLVLLVAACLTSLASPGPRNQPGAERRGPPGQTDQLLYQTIVDHVRHGEGYYPAAAAALRQGGYPLRPFVTFRMPTLAVVTAALPAWAPRFLMLLLCGATIAAWLARLKLALTRWPPVVVTGVLLLAGVFVNLQPGLEVFHEMWAGPLIALSLAVRRPGRWISAVALGLTAMLIRELALPYACAMAFFAFIEGQRREGVAWCGALLVFLLALGLHAHAVAQVVEPLDGASPGWSGLEGFGFFVVLMRISTALAILPLPAASVVLALALFGWTAWRDPASRRALAIFAGYAALIALFARGDNFYWAMMVAPLPLVGLVFAIDGLRDLVLAAMDRRRITVRRVMR